MEHIGIDNTSASIALLVGDPSRVDEICNYFNETKALTEKRGYVVAEVNRGGDTFLVVSTGIGSPSIAIAVEELYMLGIRVFIRIGTCGAIQKDIVPGSIILSTAAVRDEGTSSQYIDVKYPAVPDMDLSEVISKHLKNYQRCFLKGITHSKDSFYSEKIELQLSEDAGNHWRVLRAAGVLATDMETSSLYVISSLRKAKAASVVVAVGEDKNDLRIKEAFDYIFTILGSIISDVKFLFRDVLHKEIHHCATLNLKSFLDEKIER